MNSIYKDAIIGYSGLIGKNILKKKKFKNKYNSKNIKQIRNKNFNLLVCAGAPGSMLLANKKPKQDLNNINNLIRNLKKVKANNFILISTIQVFSNIENKNFETTKKLFNNKAYGKNRRILEKFCQKNFNNCLIVRLPSVFGDFLIKNFIYDLTNPMPKILIKQKMIRIQSVLKPQNFNEIKKIYYKKNNLYHLDYNKFLKNPLKKEIIKEFKENNILSTSFTNVNSKFQFYYLDNIWKDINLALKNKIKTIHLATEPVKANLIHKKFLKKEMKKNDAKIYRANMVTKFSYLWGLKKNYIQNKKQVLKNLEKYFKKHENFNI
mgnify:CR=1 FL=1